jgi:non-heme chloroperoxidase
MNRRLSPGWIPALLASTLFLLSGCSENALVAADPNGAPDPVDEWSETITGAGGVELTVYEVGNRNGPPIVLIHPFTQNFLTWDRQVTGPLADEFHLVGYDLRGHGTSAKPLDLESYTDSDGWADDLAAVIQAKELDRPVLVGSSYAGYIMADFVRRHGQEAVGGLVFVSAVTKAGTEEAFGHLTGEILGIFEDVLSPGLRAKMGATREFARLLGDLPADELEIALASAMMVPPQVRAAMFSRELDNDDVLAALQVPTLIVHGSDDRIVRRASSEHIASLVPDAQLLVYEGAGHLSYLEDSARFDTDLAEFVRAVHPDP